jgi:hypothetical protein
MSEKNETWEERERRERNVRLRDLRKQPTSVLIATIVRYEVDCHEADEHKFRLGSSRNAEEAKAVLDERIPPNPDPEGVLTIKAGKGGGR